jgi:putative transposase
VQPDDALLRRRLCELAFTRLAYGSRWLHVLRCGGLRMNYKKVHRLYVDEALRLQPQRHRRAATQRMHRTPVTAANQRWVMDIVHDVLATSVNVHVFTLVDVGTRDSLALRVAPRFSGGDLAALAEVGAGRHALPAVIQFSNVTEFTSTALDHWAYWNQVQLDFSGKLPCEADSLRLRKLPI